MSEYNVKEILKKIPLCPDELNLLWKKVTTDNTDKMEQLKVELVCFGIHRTKQLAEKSEVDFELLMQYIEISWFEQLGNTFTTYSQFINDIDRYLQQIIKKTFFNEEDRMQGRKQEIYTAEWNIANLDEKSKEQLQILLESLSPKYQQIVSLRLGLVDGKIYSVDEVAKIMGVTKERIQQIETKICRRYCHPRPKRNKKIKDFLES